jgi:hypothetical protein
VRLAPKYATKLLDHTKMVANGKISIGKEMFNSDQMSALMHYIIDNYEDMYGRIYQRKTAKVKLLDNIVEFIVELFFRSIEQSKSYKI